MKPLAAVHATQIVGEERLPGKSNYLFGKDRSKWVTNVPTYSRVTYQNVYPGIDLSYHGDRGQLEYDWIVRPGANPSQIRIAFSGARRVWMDGDDLVIETPAGQLRNRKPAVYQEINGIRKNVRGRYVLSKNIVGFAIGVHDSRLPLIIDPVVTYGVYFAGTYVENFDYSEYVPDPGSIIGPSVDASGNTYVVVSSPLSNFPSTGYLLGQPNSNPSCCYYAMELDSSGNIVFSTMLGFLNNANGGYVSGMATDTSGDMYLVGLAGSSLLVTPGAVQTAPTNTANTGCSVLCSSYVLKLTDGGSNIGYSTFVGGGSVEDQAWYIAVDSTGAAYLTGVTYSSNFLLTAGSINTCTGAGGVFFTKLNPAGTALIYSACVGGTVGPQLQLPTTPAGMAIDPSGNAYFAGTTSLPGFPTTPGTLQPSFGVETCGTEIDPTPCSHSFVMKMNATGTGLVYSTFLEAASQGSQAGGIAVDSSGDAYIAGTTSSPDFPTTPGVLQASYITTSPNAPADYFVSKLNPSGSSLVYSTFIGPACQCTDLGWTNYTRAWGIAVDTAGDANVIGLTASTAFPQVNPVDSGFSPFTTCLIGLDESCVDAFLFELTPGGTALAYSSYLGQPNTVATGIATDLSGNVYAAGEWSGTGVFVLKLENSSPDVVTNAASFEPQGVLVTGEIATVWGPNITNVSGILNADSLPLPTELGGSSVLVGGIPAPIFSVANVNGMQQINFQVPAAPAYTVIGPSLGISEVTIQVVNNGVQSAPLQIPIFGQVPAIFTTDGVHGAILHGATLQPVTPSSPAAPGEAVAVYAEGLGGAPPYFSTTATVSGINASVLYSGAAPDLVGISQVNITIPAGVPPGDDDLVITGTITLSNGQFSSIQNSNTVKIPVQ